VTKKTHLREPQSQRAVAAKVLSVYLDVDQSNVTNLNRSFESAFTAKVHAIEGTLSQEYEQRIFGACVSEIRKFLSAYKPAARGVVMFVTSNGPVWFREVNVGVTTDVRWGKEAYVQPFVETLDEFATYAVVVADQAHARIFTVKMATMETHADVYALGVVRHLKTAGTDHPYLQAVNHQRAGEHSLAHLKRVVELIERVVKFNPFDRLVLAGSGEATSEVFRLLTKSLRRRFVGTAVIAANAPERQILEAVLAIDSRAERAQELEKVELLIRSAAKDERAVATLAKTLEALHEKRVRELLYSQGFGGSGSVCPNCHALFAADAGNCRFCDVLLKPTDDLVENVVGTALAGGSSVEQLRGDAAKKLKAAGGIGAFLK